MYSMRENSIMVIKPFKHSGTWVFDDEIADLYEEPFVSGMPEIIDKIIKDEKIKDSHKGFSLFFSQYEFPGGNYALEWKREELGGNWYQLKGTEMEGWLCPALFKYFSDAPEEIFAQAKAINHRASYIRL